MLVNIIEYLMNLFVTGTDTGVGKTTVSAWICSHIKTKYWKLIQTGDDSDSRFVEQYADNCEIIPDAYKFKAPLSAYDASNIEKVKIDISNFATNLDKIVIEGSGGLLVPISDDFLMVDAIKTTNSAALVVARSKLGMINHILLTIEILRIRKISIVGIIVVGCIEQNIYETIEKFSREKIIAILPLSTDLKTLFYQTKIPQEIFEVLS